MRCVDVTRASASGIGSARGTPGRGIEDEMRAPDRGICILVAGGAWPWPRYAEIASTRRSALMDGCWRATRSLTIARRAPTRWEHAGGSSALLAYSSSSTTLYHRHDGTDRCLLLVTRQIGGMLLVRLQRSSRVDTWRVEVGVFGDGQQFCCRVL